MRVLLALIATLFVATGAVAQQGKAPKGCITCEAMCNWCASLVGRPKADGERDVRCRNSCKSWGAAVGLKTVYVEKKKHLCSSGSFAPRCN